MDDSDSDSSVERILNENYSFFRNSFITKDHISKSNTSSASPTMLENGLESQVEPRQEVAVTKPTDKADECSRYANLTLEELDSFAERIKIYHEVGVVVPAKIVPCKNKYKKNNNKKTPRLQQSTRKRKTTYGQGRIGIACSSFGVKHCMCCNVDKENCNTVGEQNALLISGNNCNSPIIELDTSRPNGAHEFDPLTRTLNEQPSTFRSWTRPLETETVTNSEYAMPHMINLRSGTVRATVDIHEPPLRGIGHATSTPINIHSSRRLNKIDLNISEIEIDNAESNDYFVEESVEVAENNNNNDTEKEDQIMEFVDDLLGTTANTIEEEVEERYQRLNETRRVASDAISNAISSNHDAVQVHEEMDLEHSVILVSVGSPQPILVEEDSIIQLEDSICNNRTNFVETGVRTRRKAMTIASCSKRIKTSPKKPVESTDEPKKVTSEGSAALRECSICLEPLAKRELSATTCGHVFCTDCITAAIRSSKMCPICRTKLTLKKIHPLYL